jgi:sialate O-acetylesterase
MNMKSKSPPILLALLLASLLPTFTTQAEIRPNSLFANNCILQRGVRVPVWGTATSGEEITVTFAGQTVSTIATNGAWKVWLKPMKANATPQDLTIQGDTNDTFTNVLVGDVWVAGGQSNMERQLGPRPPQPEIIRWREEAATANYPEIREYFVPRKLAAAPVADAGGHWWVCSPSTVTNISAIGYFFARAIHKSENVPLGILLSTLGGTVAEAWTSSTSLKSMPDFRNAVQAMEDQPPSTLMASNVTVLYNGMIAPLQAFPIKGVIWYQGESNCGRERQYGQLFPLLIADWRSGWGLGDFPFLFVQIAPCMYWTPEIREAQLQTLKKSKNTAMVVTVDVGDVWNMHPPQKAPVGERLALAARALAYGERIEYSGPLYNTLNIKDGRAVVTFTHTSGGLMAKDGGLKGFTIAGADMKFVPAKAEIKGKTVEVWSDEIKSPIAVRYGWAKVPDVNLFNQEGLPASPFRTDDEQL